MLIKYRYKNNSYDNSSKLFKKTRFINIEKANDYFVHDNTPFRNNILFLNDKINIFIDNSNMLIYSSDILRKIFYDSLLCSTVIPKKQTSNVNKLFKNKLMELYNIDEKQLDIIDFPFPFDKNNDFHIYIVLIKNKRIEKEYKYKECLNDLKDIRDFNYNKILFNLNLLAKNNQVISLMPKYLWDIIQQQSNDEYYEIPDILNQKNAIFDLTNSNSKLEIIDFENKYNDNLSIYLFMSRLHNNMEQESIIKTIMSKDNIINELNNIKE